MGERRIATRIQNKHDFEYNWNRAENFIPYAGEIIVYDREIEGAGDNVTKIMIKSQNGNWDYACALANRPNDPFTYERFKIGDGKRYVYDLPFADFYFEAGDNVTVTTDPDTGKVIISATDTDTHYTAGMVVSNSNTGNSNAVASNGNVHINLLDNNIIQASHKLTGTGGTTITSDASGNIAVNTNLYTNKGQNIDGAMTQKAVTDAIDGLIACGTADPTTNTTSQFYFKYSE